MTNHPAPTPAGRSLRPRLPLVLRQEPQYRLLFFGQLLSILGFCLTIRSSCLRS